MFSQVCVRGGVVWALSEHKALFYREGVNSYCSEGDGWKYDTVRYCRHCCSDATPFRRGNAALHCPKQTGPLACLLDVWGARIAEH